MNFIGNIIWILLGGLVTSVMYILAGVLFCITIVGIPFGYQLIKIGLYAFCPFGREMTFDEGEPGCLSIIGNLLWILCGWWEIALVHMICGLIFCITIVGIPFGIQHFKIAASSIFPFGQSNRRIL
ncbi:MAG: YccF domain-containing protein [Bacteroidales bacterium]|nr:YccF domain-containing protein [Bacteroidales bacterium]